MQRKYNAEWAVVTGASSGIGRAITEKLAQQVQYCTTCKSPASRASTDRPVIGVVQGINVAMVALDDSMFAEVFAKMHEEYVCASQCCIVLGVRVFRTRLSQLSRCEVPSHRRELGGRRLLVGGGGRMQGHRTQSHLQQRWFHHHLGWLLFLFVCDLVIAELQSRGHSYSRTRLWRAKWPITNAMPPVSCALMPLLPPCGFALLTSLAFLTAAVKLTHHFANCMLDRKQKGAIFFTSSPAGAVYACALARAV